MRRISLFVILYGILSSFPAMAQAIVGSSLTVTSPPSTMNQAIQSTQNAAGSTTSNCLAVLAFQFPCLNQFVISADTADASSPTNAMDGWQFNHNVGGSTVKGARQTVDSILNFTAPSSASNTNRNYVPLVSQMNAFVGDGGTGLTLLTAKGSFFGSNSVVRVLGDNNLGTIGTEIDVLLWGTAVERYGISTISYPRHQAAMLSQDGAYEVGAISDPNQVGWHNALLLSNISGAPPLDTSGCVICSDGSANTIALGMDLSPYSISAYFLKSKGFSVDGPTGNVIANSLSIVKAGDPASPYTPIISCGIGALGGVSGTARFQRLAGKVVFFEATATISANGTCAGYVSLSLPFQAASTSILAGRANAISGKSLQGVVNAGALTVNVFDYANIYPGATGENITVSGVYEIN